MAVVMTLLACHTVVLSMTACRLLSKRGGRLDVQALASAHATYRVASRAAPVKRSGQESANLLFDPASGSLAAPLSAATLKPCIEGDTS
jgi:hypothetical protein